MSIISPNNNTSLIIDDFINYATSHLSTIGGVINTISLYPPVQTPGPGVIIWTGYTVTPARPGSSVAPIEEVDTAEIEMNDAQLLASDNATLEGEDINEATVAGFEIPQDSEPPTFDQIEETEIQFVEDAQNEPDPELSEEDKPKGGIQPEPNYKTKVKVPYALVTAMKKYGIGTTNLERAHFLAQCDHESGGFIYKQELASGAAYEGRADLGNTQPGDGVRYKGRGYIQLTGRANYRKFGPVAGADFEGNPAIVASEYYADTACMFWKSNKLAKKCTDDTTTTIKVVTKKINGGYNGLDDRIRKFTKYWTELQKDPTLWT